MLIVFFAATVVSIAAMWFGLASRQRRRGVASSNSPDGSWMFMDGGASSDGGSEDCGSATDGGGGDCGGGDGGGGGGD